MKTKFNLKQFVIITLLTSIWIHVSEVFRYFILVMPGVKSFFDDKSGIAEMDFSIFLIWVLWDTLLTAVMVFLFWLFKSLFGNHQQSVLASSTFIWLAIFVVFWIATANMGLSEWNTLLLILPLAWFEMFIGTWITSQLYKRKENGYI